MDGLFELGYALEEVELILSSISDIRSMTLSVSASRSLQGLELFPVMTFLFCWRNLEISEKEMWIDIMYLYGYNEIEQEHADVRSENL